MSLLGFPLAVAGGAGDVRVVLWRGGKLIDLLEGSYDCRRAAGTDGFSARYNRFRVQRGDRMLLCSDGLWGTVGDEGIARALRFEGPPGEALCRCMLGLEYADSASAVLVRV